MSYVGKDRELAMCVALRQSLDIWRSFHIEGSVLSLFPSQRHAQPGAIRQTDSPPCQASRVPQFIVVRDPVSASAWESLKTLFTRVKLPPSRNLRTVFRHVMLARPQFASRSFGASFALHLCSFLVLVYLPQVLPGESFAASASPRPERIYYSVPLLDRARVFPRLVPLGPGGRPGSGPNPDRLPPLGSNVSHRNLVVVSKPARPDNSHQTIYQPASPPDLIIPSDIKLPDVFAGNPVQVPRPQLKYNPSDARPLRSIRRFDTDPAPVAADGIAAAPLHSLVEPSNSHPQIAFPSAVASAPQPRAGGSPAPQGEPPVEDSNTAGGLLVIGVNPSGPASTIVLPPGNRWGEFVISPATGDGGSPAGSPTGVPGGGTGGNGAGGDGSTGIGPGGGGGGGGKSGTASPVSISGTGPERGGTGVLGSAVALSLVYPVAPHLNFRKNPLVVSAGPVGGGGLNVYGALHCGKIYTIFLVMPGKNWTMQYCQKSDATGRGSSQSRSTVIHLDSGLVPPDPDLESRFDFQRLPVPEDKANKMIILKGTLGADGAIGGLEVFQSIFPENDEAARIAFSKWKFKPAMRDGKPVAVEILVGVPVDAGTGNPSNSLEK